jgi:hypothetical protein
MHNEKLHNLYPSSTIIRMINSRIMRWVWNVARMGRRRPHTRFWLESQKERDNWEDLDVVITDLLKAFLGNGSVNTFQRAIVEDVSQWTNPIARC